MMHMFNLKLCAMNYNFEKRFRLLKTQQLVDRFNEQTANNAWATAKGYYLVALVNELVERGIDISAIGDINSFSMKEKVILDGKMLQIKKSNQDEGK
jgi:hypothetical protein